MSKDARKQSSAVVFALAGALFLLAEETVFRFSTAGFVVSDLPRISLFSCFYSVMMTACFLFIPPKLRRPLRRTVLYLLAFLFAFQYFVYMQFKVFYDLRTIFCGAADALGGFGSQVWRLLASFQGVEHLSLFFIPLYIDRLILKKHDFDVSLRPSLSRLLCLASAISFLLGQIVLKDPAVSSLLSHYRYDTSIRRFGLVTGILLDLEHLGSGGTAAFTEEDVPLPEDTPIPQVQYRQAVLDIDFDLLGENASPGQAALDDYVRHQTPSSTNEMTGIFKGMNIIFITAEAFSREVIDPVRTPALYRLYEKGIHFEDFYQPASAGTTGGEYQNLMGVLPMYGGASMKMTADEDNWFTLASLLTQEGYEGWAFHNNDYTFYDRHLTHNNLGYSHGFTGVGNGLEEYLSDQWPASDKEMIENTIPMYIDKEPFQIYYMTISGHNPNNNALAAKHIDKVKEDLPEDVRYYLAANMELEDGIAGLLEALEKAGIANRTVIVLTTDHFPYGLDLDASFLDLPNLSALYGFQPQNYLERDHNALLIWSGILEDREPVIVADPVSGIDILPTLCNLFDVKWDSRLFTGRDVFSEKEPLVFTVNCDWKTDKGTYSSAADEFIPAPGVSVSEAYIEAHHTIVRNKLSYCEEIQRCCYLTYVAEGIRDGP